MNKEFKVEILLSPVQNTDRPYFWRLACSDANDITAPYYTICSDFAASPEEACKHAVDVYNRNTLNNVNGQCEVSNSA